MQKKFMQLLLPGLGYMLMGNLLATVMTISIGAVSKIPIIIVTVTLFAMAIYLMTVSVPAYRDGELLNTKQKNKNNEDVKNMIASRHKQWITVGLIMWAVMLVPSVLFLLNVYPVGTYRLLNGAVHPLSLLLVDGSGAMWGFAPFVMMAFYGASVAACHIGFMTGLKK